MTLTWKTVAGGVGILLVLGFGWLKVHDAQVRRDTLARARADSLRAALVNVKVLTARLSERDQALAIAQHDASEALAVARQRLDAMTMRVARLRGQANVPPETVVVALADEVDACKAALGDCDSLNVITLGRLAVKDSALAELTVALDVTTTAWKEALARASPGFFARLAQSFPYVVSALAVGVVAGIVIQ